LIINKLKCCPYIRPGIFFPYTINRVAYFSENQNKKLKRVFKPADT
jgi:hypothetical protein